MRILATFFISMVAAFAVNLSTYNIYERSDRVDVMLSFDAPYKGNIFQKRENDMMLIVFNDLNFDQVVEKSINSKIMQELYIEPKQNSVILSIKSNAEISVGASKTADGFGLRVRVTSSTAIPENNVSASQTRTQTIQTKEQTASDFLDARYYIVLGVLLGLLIVLFIARKSIKKNTGVLSQNSGSVDLINGLFKNKTTNEDINVIYEKPIDRLNKVMLLSYQKKKYLVLVGSSNVLLDKFGEEKIKSEEDFQAFFEDNKKKLENYLHERQNSLNSYKEKMSAD